MTIIIIIIYRLKSKIKEMYKIKDKSVSI